jgi:hypothetical protein
MERMSEQPTTPEAKPQATNEPFDAEYVRSLRFESKKWRLRAREAEAQLNELREKTTAAPAAKTAEGDGVDDLRAKLERLEADLAAKDAALLRQQIASEYQLPPVLAKRLEGSTEDELRADAEALKGLVAPATPAAPAQPQRPVTSVPNGLPATGKSEADLRRQFLGGGGRDSVPVTQQEERDDGRLIFSSR